MILFLSNNIDSLNIANNIIGNIFASRKTNKLSDTDELFFNIVRCSTIDFSKYIKFGFLFGKMKSKKCNQITAKQKYFKNRIYFYKNSNGKIKCKNLILKVSASNKNNLLVIAFSTSKIGIDLEEMKYRNYDKISKKFHTDDICDNLLSFYKCWTAKECLAKANNITLIQALSTKINFSDFNFFFFNNYILATYLNKTF